MLSNTLVSPPPPTPPARRTSTSLSTYSQKRQAMMVLCNHMCMRLAEAAESFITVSDVMIVSFSFVCVFVRGLQCDKEV